jgi:RimJ/RimL family protein N-acetyltransferase
MRVRFRPATMDDSDLLFEWRDDPVTQANSCHHEPIDPEKHLAWLTASIADPLRSIYIFEIDDVPIGTVREDWKGGGNEWKIEISWTVAPTLRSHLKRVFDFPIR